MIPTRQDLDALFGLYDADGSGALDYKEFSTSVFGRSSSGSPSKANNSTSDLAALAERLQKKLIARGARGIIGLGKSFRIMDDNNSRSLDVNEFTKAMRDYALGFSD